MKRAFFALVILFFTGFRLIAGTDIKDTLILNDGSNVTGTIGKKSLDAFQNMQADLNTYSTTVEQEDGKTVKVPNKDVNYFVVQGVRYANRHMSGGNKFLRVIVDGKASVYAWSGTVKFGYTQSSAPSNGWVTKTTTYHNEDIGTHIFLFLNDKNYSANAKYIKNNFSIIFADCPKLIDEVKGDSKFDYADLATVATKYNACFTTDAGH